MQRPLLFIRLKGWERSGELLAGRYDMNNHSIMGPWLESIPRAEWAVLEKSSHMPALEEPDRYAEPLTNFLL
jgi:L-proline amide hydrolase